MPQYRIDLTFSRFRSAFKEAKKKHRSIEADLSVLLGKLEVNPASTDFAVAIPGFARDIWKARVPIKGHSGKSGGYRLIYHVDEGNRIVTPLFFHAKSEIEAIPKREIAAAIKQLIEKLASPTTPGAPAEPSN